MQDCFTPAQIFCLLKQNLRVVEWSISQSQSIQSSSALHLSSISHQQGLSIHWLQALIRSNHMPANEVLWKHENECCVLKWLLVVKKEIGISWDSQEPLVHKIHKDKVFIIPQELGPAGPSQAGLSNIKASDSVFCWTPTPYYPIIMKQSATGENRQVSRRPGSTEISGTAALAKDHTLNGELPGSGVTQSSCRVCQTP